MKLQDLLEMPKLVDKEANFTGSMTPFYSQNTIDRDFDIIYKGSDETTKENFYVAMRKAGDIAVIGKPGIRDTDKSPGMIIIGTAEFKSKPDVSSNQWINFSKNVLQIDSVEVASLWKTRGYGFYLYFALAAAGYCVIR